jgi:predicted GIY-YIG superfamily endonuclease
MAREKVVKVRCDRCKRTELVPAASEKVGADFEASFQGQRLVYEDLCGRCRDAVKNIWAELKEWDREVKYTLIKNAPANSQEAAPLQPAPNYSPPQPHAAAAVKR